MEEVRYTEFVKDIFWKVPVSCALMEVKDYTINVRKNNEDMNCIELVALDCIWLNKQNIPITVLSHCLIMGLLMLADVCDKIQLFCFWLSAPCVDCQGWCNRSVFGWLISRPDYLLSSWGVEVKARIGWVCNLYQMCISYLCPAVILARTPASTVNWAIASSFYILSSFSVSSTHQCYIVKITDYIK